MLKRITYKRNMGWVLTNCCDTITPDGGIPMVGSKYCKENCPYFKGILNVFGFEFVKCKK